MEIIKHFKTISYHKMLVMKGCFAVGLYKQGMIHDLSKYSLTEFSVGAKYYQGNRSPNNAEREDKGCSISWIHHKGRNKHHYEYWYDYQANVSEGMVPVPMPHKYVVEMLMDRIAASKTYNKSNYDDKLPLAYYKKGMKYERACIHPETKKILELFLEMLANNGEKETFSYIRKNILNKRDRSCNKKDFSA